MLTKPILGLNINVANYWMKLTGSVAALPDGGAFVINFSSYNGTNQVLRINATGQIIQHLHQCRYCQVSGVLVLHNNLYVIYNRDKLVEININNISILQVYTVPLVRMKVNYGSLSYHPSVITHPDSLLLADHGKGEIFSYNVKSQNKEVHLTNLSYPTSVSFMIYNSHLYYVVCERGRQQVHIFNSTWGLFKTLGDTRGSEDGQFNSPWSAIGLPDGVVIISDTGNKRVSLFSIHGKFVRHILTPSDGLNHPSYMSISLPYLWLADKQPIVNRKMFSRLYRYKLY